MRIVYLLLIVVSLLISVRSAAFPQMVMKGYTNCAACHVNTSGGGLLTTYGRTMNESVELPIPSWLQIGGDVRMLQQYVETVAFERRQFILMQADLEVGVLTEHVQVVGTVGREPYTEGLFSRRHYAQFKAGNNYLRVGKLFRTYGIRWPDHYLFVRKDLGMDAGTEAYRAEFAHVAEKWEANVSAGEEGYDGRVGYVLHERFKLAAGVLSVSSKFAIGVDASFRACDQLSFFIEFNFGDTMIEHSRVQLQIQDGVSLFVSQQYVGYVDSPVNRKTAYSLGLEIMPSAHVVVAGVLQKSTFSDSAFLLLHLYL